MTPGDTDDESGGQDVVNAPAPLADLDVDLEAADDPVAELRAAIREQGPAWRIATHIELDAETAERYRPAFEAALEDSHDEFLNLIGNMGESVITITVDGESLTRTFKNARRE